MRQTALCLGSCEGETHAGRWFWRDAEGRLLAVKDRVDGPAKPGSGRSGTYISTWRSYADSKADRWGRLRPGARDFQMPLYNAQELKERPDTGVVLVEGEKSADAAADSCLERPVATTAMGRGCPSEGGGFLRAGWPCSPCAPRQRPGGPRLDGVCLKGAGRAWLRDSAPRYGRAVCREPEPRYLRPL